MVDGSPHVDGAPVREHENVSRYEDVWHCEGCGRNDTDVDALLASDCPNGRVPYYSNDEPDRVVLVEKKFEHWVGRLIVYRDERYKRDERYELAKRLATQRHVDIAARLGAVPTNSTWMYYANDGGYIGADRDLEFLRQRGIVPETIPGNMVCSIGFSATSQTWWGWSHRAAACFTIGYVTKEGDYCTTVGVIPEALAEDPSLDKSVPVGFVCITLDDCKRCAIAFADAVG